ncbi:MAG: dinitrogenase iron-molybdenum cofactor biosynthesis protein [Clostridiales Family XIII bacterium]|jgi:predicted Fe-Mo cluster-binding NifX family protein|nr:dinitrogenase iron-molybdenum cofactor biosynthesis protein [Clostridiales Family XIII bacterium]
MSGANGKRPHRLAVSTTDGLTVYVHFGQAVRFWIYDLVDGVYEYVEQRDVPRGCGPDGHSTEVFDVILEILSDCEAVVVGKIGPGAAEYVLSRGLRIFQGPGVLEVTLPKVAAVIGKE